MVSPHQEGTTAGRLLEKRGGDGGYMVILQVEDIAAARKRIADAGARVVSETNRDGGKGCYSHIHPRVIGGASVSVDFMDPWERWEWGGPEWSQHLKTDTSVGIVGAEIQADDPPAMAGRWSEILGQPAREHANFWCIPLDEGCEVRFVEVADDRGEGLSRFDVKVRDPDKVREAARARGKLREDGDVTIVGTRVRLVQA